MSNEDQSDYTGPLSLIPLRQSDDLPGRLWTFDEFTADEERSAADPATGLTSVGFIRAALRRSAWLWCATALVGLLAGFGVFRALPPAYRASTSILLGNDNFELPANAALDDQAMAQSQTVAGDALRALGMQQSPASFVAHYTVTVVTSRVLLFTVSAPSSQAAVREANALTTAFLQFQTQVLKVAAGNISTLLQQQIILAQRQVSSINRQISRLSAERATPARSAELSSLHAESSRASSALTSLETSTAASATNTQVYTQTLVGGSRVLDPATPIVKSRKKLLLEYVASGLIVGLALGMAIVVIRALLSDRLRRRDDVARALGAPVRLSVGKVRLRRWLPGPRGLAAAQGTEVQRIVAHLVNSMPPGVQGTAALAVVPVDDPQVAALSLASLAWGCAQGLPDLQVLLADLCPGAPAARLLGVQEPGVREVRVQGVRLVVAVPDRDDVVPVGPLGRASTALAAKRSAFTEAVGSAFSSADLLLTLAALDPSFGGDHLAGWAPGAVAVVTAGQSSAERIHAVGEMIRLGGTELLSAVLVGADKTDESLGVTGGSSSPASADLGPGSLAR